jgi:hypothetical protein
VHISYLWGYLWNTDRVRTGYLCGTYRMYVGIHELSMWYLLAVSGLTIRCV